MKAAPFRYERPATIAEAVEMLGEDGAKVLAGGQSLVPLMAMRLARPTVLVDLNAVPGIDGANVEEDGTLVVGALTRQRQLERHPRLRTTHPIVAATVPLIGHSAIRIRGTVCGSLAHADPSAEWPALAALLDAQVDVAGSSGMRRLPAVDLFVGPFMTTLADDEVLAGLRVSPQPLPGFGVAEVARRHGDFALAGALALVALDGDVVLESRVAIFAVAARAQRLRAVEDALRSAQVADIDRIVGDVVPGPVDVVEDIQASSAFRASLARTVVGRALRQAVERAREVA